MSTPFRLLYRDNPELIGVILVIIIAVAFFAGAAYLGGYAASKGANRARQTNQSNEDGRP